MRTGAEYREALRDGRRVWIMGGGWIDDVTTHPATRAMVEEYVAWYDRHFDPAWRDALLRAREGRRAHALGLRAAAHRRRPDRHGPVVRQDAVPSAPATSPTTPAYGNLIALGVLTTVQARDVPPQQAENALAYRDMVARTGRFITYCGGAPIVGQRMRPDPAERVALKLVRETDAGVVISGRLGMHTSPAYAEDVYVGGMSGVDIGGQRAGFIVPVGAPGVTTLCRKMAARDPNPFVSPLSAGSTSSTARCGSTRCSCRGSTCSWSAPSPTRSPAGCAGTTSTAGSPRPSSPSAWRWRWPMRWG